MRFDLDRLPTDPVILHKIVRDMADVVEATQGKLKASEATIKALTLRLEKTEHRLSCLLRVQYGRSSEKQDIAQLRLMFDDVATPQAANDEAPAAAQSNTSTPRKTGRRAPLGDHLPRQVVQHDVAGCNDDCPGPLVQIDETVTEVLDYVPARFRVIRHVRPRMACRHCERIHQVPAVDLPLPKVMITSALHAHLLVSRFVDHQPWNRQSVIFRRAGVHIDRDVMSRWARKLAALMAPLGERLLAYILEGDKIHGDDTPVTLLSDSEGSEIARLWVYLKHDLSSGDMSPRAVAFRFSEDRSGEHPAAHLANYQGYFQADAFPGYNALYCDPETKTPRDINRGWLLGPCAA